MYLKQSTAYTFRLGPFLDETDGFTQEDSLTIAVADCYLSKAGAALAAKTEATALTGTGALGHYTCVLDGTDTGTLGGLRVFVHVAGALPVWQDFIVVPSNVYDSLVAGSDALQVDTIQVSGTVQTANDVGADVDAILVDTGTTIPGLVGSPAADLAADIAAVKVDTAATLADTAELQTDWVNDGRLDIILDAILADTGTDGVVVNAASLAADAAQEIADALLATVAETQGSYTVQQILSILLAVLAGVTASSGATLKSPDGVATRVAATINASAERTAMTLTPSA